MRVRANLGNIVSATTSKGPINNPIKPQIGKVFGVVLNENTPSKELFERAGGWDGIGTVYYLDYDKSKNVSIEEKNNLKIAKPLFSFIQSYPLIGELIYIVDAPSPVSQISNTSNQKYYLGTVNLWNNNQQNAITGTSLGKTFSENADIRRLIPFEGDIILQGRKGNGIRFGTTTRLYSNINEWSSIGNDGDPITIMVNGYITTDKKDLKPNVEEINKELSSIYMTSTQKLPLIPGVSIVNPRVNTIKPKDYTSPQLILNSDRVTLNAKKDEVLLFAKGNIELNTDNIVNINAGRVAHINSPSIALGTNKDGSYPTEPVLLGGQTHDLLLEICNTLGRLAGYLATATVATTEGAIPVIACNHGGEQLFNDVNNLIDKLGTIQSNNVYTI